MITVLHGDCLTVLAGLEADSFSAAVTDPPYHLTSIVKRFGGENAAPAKSNGATGVYGRASKGFMGKTWDGGDVAFRPETWAAVSRVLRPGAHLVAFGGTRTYHRLVCAIEDAGFEIRDAIMWHYGSGFPKSHDASAALDRTLLGRWCDEYELERGPVSHAAAIYEGHGTALKPATEIICVARKPLSEGTVAANVLKWGTGAINVDAGRVNPGDPVPGGGNGKGNYKYGDSGRYSSERPHVEPHANGRWPPNCAHDGSPEVLEAFARFGERASGSGDKHPQKTVDNTVYGAGLGWSSEPSIGGDTGTAARFFFSAPYGMLCDLCKDEVTLCQSAKDAGESSGQTNEAGNGASAQSVAQQPSLLDGAANQPRSNTIVPNAASPADHSPRITAASVPNDAREWPVERIAQNARSAGRLCASCATVIARKLVALRQGHSPESQASGGLFTEPIEQILNRNLALYAEGRANTDTIMTIPSLKMLLGSVSAAIADITTSERSEANSRSRPSAARFAFHSKAQSWEREGGHPTVKPTNLMLWLVNLICPPGGAVLDPFCGTGSTLVACDWMGIEATGIELSAETCADAERKIKRLRARRMLGDVPSSKPLPDQLDLLSAVSAENAER